MTETQDLHTEWMKDPAYRKAHEALAPEFVIAHAVIEARSVTEDLHFPIR